MLRGEALPPNLSKTIAISGSIGRRGSRNDTKVYGARLKADHFRTSRQTKARHDGRACGSGQPSHHVTATRCQLTSMTVAVSHKSRLRCVLLNVRYAPIATKFHKAATVPSKRSPICAP
jgi:hypothetical protein